MTKMVVFGNSFQREYSAEIARLFSDLSGRGCLVTVERDFHAYLNRLTTLPPLPTAACGDPIDADLALSLGGDGTFLTTVMWVAEQGIPIIGINTGHLGYLTTCNIAEADRTIAEWQQGLCTVERRSMLAVECDSTPIEHPLALNDIAILRQDTSSMIELETSLDGLPLTTYKGDGLVVCTPTGSTAYNLSAGGPILEPSTRCIALSPLSPHSLSMRPLVVPDSAEITIVTRSRATHYQVSVDGEAVTCPTGSRVTIRRADTMVKVVQHRHHNFAATLRHKLHWGE